MIRSRGVLFFLESLLQDFRFALRTLRKSPGFTAIGVITLALGIGANTAIFSAVNGILLEPLPYADSSRLARIESLTRNSNSDNAEGLSLPTIQDVRTQCPAFEELATFTAYTGSRIQSEVAADVVSAPRVSGNFFLLLRVKPLFGRLILPSDAEPGNERVTILNYALWKEDFGGDPSVVGGHITIDDLPYTIIGVMPQDFIFGTHARGLWTPFVQRADEVLDRDARDSFILAKIKRSVSLDQANGQLSSLAARLSEAYPDKEKGRRLVARSVKEELVGGVRTPILLLFGAVILVLLIASLNISGLLLTRGWGRQREIAIREALGAKRLRIVQQLFVEGMVLALAGGMLGTMISVWGIQLLRALAPSKTPRIENLQLDSNVLVFTLAVSILAGIMFGLVPAVQTSSRRMYSLLQQNLSTSPLRFSVRSPHRLRATLVVFEVAIALILVVGATLVVRSFEKLVNINLGYRTDHILTMSVLFSQAACDYRKPTPCQQALNDVLERLRSLHGVESAAATSIKPLGGEMATNTLYIEGLMDGQNVSEGTIVQYRHITSDYFRAIGLPLITGRSFAGTDTRDTELVAVVNQMFDKQYLLGDPIGRRIAISKDRNGVPHWMRIVGEVGDSRDVNIKSKPKPQFYVPIPQSDYLGGSLVIRTAGNPMALAGGVRQEIRAVDRNAPILGLQTMDQAVAEKVSEPKFETTVLSTLAALALGLAMLGVYGLISIAVNQRTREIGVRIALGASQRAIMRMVIGEGMRLVLCGIGIGICGAVVLSRFLRSLLFEVKPTDFVTLVSVVLLFVIVALVACFIPARRAIRVHPAVALRYE